MSLHQGKKVERRHWLSLSFFELMTTIIAALGFIWVAQGLKSTEVAVGTDTYLKTYGWTLDIDKAMVDNPTVRPYLASDSSRKLPPNFPDSEKVYATADYMLDVFDAVLRNETYFSRNPKDELQWKESVEDYFRKSSVLCDRFTKNHALYSDTLNAIFNRR